MEKQKNYEELTIRDPFMFGKISSKPENRKLILDSLLQIDLKERSGDIEKHIQAYKDAKYARLDLLVEDESGTIYDAEMQNKSKDRLRQEELPLRSRYYQSIIDTSFFDSGKDYIYLQETYIAFICTFDPFGKNLPIYTFETKCLETDIPEYNEKTHKIFFNTTADLSNLPQSIRNMLEYINSGVTSDSATESINNEVIDARLREEWRSEYMLTLVHDKDVYRDGFDDGMAEGYNSRQSEVDTLTKALSVKDSALADKDAALAAKDIELENLKKELAKYKPN